MPRVTAGLDSASVASASARCTCRRSAGVADWYTAERTSGCRKRTRSPNSIKPAASAAAAASASIPNCSAARHSRGISPTGSAAATSSSVACLLWQGRQLPEKALLEPVGQRSRAARCRRRTERQLRRSQHPRGARARPAGRRGCDLVPADRVSRRPPTRAELPRPRSPTRTTEAPGVLSASGS